jgi:hypothetical protein
MERWTCAVIDFQKARADRAAQQQQKDQAMSDDPDSSKKQPEVMTIEAIKRDQWKAVELDIPEDAGRELLTEIQAAARKIMGDGLGEQATSLAEDREYEAGFRLYRLDRLQDPQAMAEKRANDEWVRKALSHIVSNMLASGVETGEMEKMLDLPPGSLDTPPSYLEDGQPPRLETEPTPAVKPKPEPMTPEEAWKQPAFSVETIRADEQTAVYLPIPENADEFLLEEASRAAFRRYESLSRALEAVTEDNLGMDEERGFEQRQQAGERVQGIAARINAILLTYDPADPFREKLITAADRAHIVATEMAALQIPAEACTAHDAAGVSTAPAEPTPPTDPAYIAEQFEKAAARQEEVETRLEQMNVEIDRDRQGIDESRADTIYDRYPGLSRDDSVDERDRDNDEPARSR